MKIRIMKCPSKINKKCNRTSKSCDHAVKHKETEFCNCDKNNPGAYKVGCVSCVEVGEE